MPHKRSQLNWDVPPAKWSVTKKYVGSWRITELQGFAADYIDLGGPGELKISSRGTGRMNFGAVSAELDCKMDDRAEDVLRFSFEGGDDGDSISGRGYCLVDGDQMTGRIFLHFGDEFAVRASRRVKVKNG